MQRHVPGLRVAVAAALLVLIAGDLGLSVAPPAPWGAEDPGTLPGTGRPTFREVTASVGLGAWRHGGYTGSGNLTSSTYFTEFTGPGACWLDADGDGWLDLYLVSGVYQTHPWLNEVRHPRSSLFRNLGDGTFADATDATGAGLVGTYQGCAAADYDGDGRTDLLVLGWGGNVLFRNLGGAFANVTDAAGMRDRDCGAFLCWGSSASWLDYDRDGCLDAYVNHFTDYDPANAPPINGPGPGQRNRLYRNACDGTFADVTAAANLSNEKHDSWSSVAFDANGDRWPDLYVSNDGDENVLYLNRGDGTFRLHMSAASDPRSGMGTAVGDADHDGDYDLVTTNYVGQTNGVFLAAGADYVDVGDDAPFDDARPYSGWATHWFDYNNDGWQDLFAVNGFTEDTGIIPMEEPLVAYEHRGGGAAWRTSRTLLGDDLQGEWVGRGGAWADLDNDGDVDFVLAEAGDAPTHLFRSDRGAGNFLNLDLVGTAPGVTRGAVGTEVVVTAPGLPPQHQAKTAGSGFLGSNDPRLHVGVGHAASADVTVRWPDGTDQAFPGLRANTFLRLVQGQAAPEVLRVLPLVRLEGPEAGARLQPLTFRASAEVAPGAGLAGVAWDLGGEAAASGPEATHAFGDVGAYIVRATATDTLGQAKTQAHKVVVSAPLQAHIRPEKSLFLPHEPLRGNVTVTFEDGAPVRAAHVRLTATFSLGHAAADEAVAALPRVVRDLLRSDPVTVEGTTDAEGRFAFALPWTAPQLRPDRTLEANRPGVYTLTAVGGARGSVFEPAEATFGVAPALMAP